MKKRTAKWFYKGKYVVVNIAYPDKTVRKYYEVPNNNLVLIKGIEKGFTIDEISVVSINGVPNYFYNSNSTTPIRFYPTDEEMQFIQMTPEKLFGGIENKLITEMFSKFAKGESMNLGTLLAVFSVLLILGLGVYMFMSFKDINETLQQMQEIINRVWG